MNFNDVIISVVKSNPELSFNGLLARNAFVRTNRRAIAMLFVRLSVCLSVWDGRALRSDVHFSTDLTLWLDSQTIKHHYTLNDRFTVSELRQLRSIWKLDCAYARLTALCFWPVDEAGSRTSLGVGVAFKKHIYYYCPESSIYNKH